MAAHRSPCSSSSDDERYSTFLEPSFFPSSSSLELRATTDADWAFRLGAQLPASVFFGETLNYLGREKSKRQLLVPVLKRSTVPWHTLLERLLRWLFSDRRFHLKAPMPAIDFSRQRQISCMQECHFRPNISKWIATTFVENFLMHLITLWKIAFCQMVDLWIKSQRESKSRRIRGREGVPLLIQGLTKHLMTSHWARGTPNPPTHSSITVWSWLAQKDPYCYSN